MRCGRARRAFSRQVIRTRWLLRAENVWTITRSLWDREESTERAENTEKNIPQRHRDTECFGQRRMSFQLEITPSLCDSVAGLRDPAAQSFGTACQGATMRFR